ncbi:hypothetical protein BDZ45DRAFT_210220 [Acephala macrosclerotiorum]|nr:hypothetical protein BDZ45DRAFT_210220 [Acephala macrosclerotiorum]
MLVDLVHGVSLPSKWKVTLFLVPWRWCRTVDTLSHRHKVMLSLAPHLQGLADIKSSEVWEAVAGRFGVNEGAESRLIISRSERGQDGPRRRRSGSFETCRVCPHIEMMVDMLGRSRRVQRALFARVCHRIAGKGEEKSGSASSGGRRGLRSRGTAEARLPRWQREN